MGRAGGGGSGKKFIGISVDKTVQKEYSRALSGITVLYG